MGRRWWRGSVLRSAAAAFQATDIRTTEQSNRQTYGHRHRVGPGFRRAGVNKVDQSGYKHHTHQRLSNINPLNARLKPQSNGLSYSNTVIGTLAVDGWAVTFGTARRRLCGAAARLSPSSL